MANYSNLVPFLNIAPPPGYLLHQVLPLDRLAGQIQGHSAILEFRRDVILEGKLLNRREDTLVLKDDEWEEAGAELYELGPVEGVDWTVGQSLAFLETRVSIREATFTQRREPSSYVVFSGVGRKSFLSDNSPKFSHQAVIQQISTYGKWAEGFPACVVDPARDSDYSVILINPYERPAVVTLEFEGQVQTRKVRVGALAAQRVAFSSILGTEGLPWSGQAYVSGPNRIVIFFVSHSLTDPTNVNTMEHTDPYRGHTHWFSFTRALHFRVRSENGLR